MQLQEFINNVRGMRDHQKAYFKDRKQSDLIRSKTFERLVDKGLAEGVVVVDAISSESGMQKAEVTQVSLFEEAGDVEN
jgi:hypothetical protein